MKYNLAFFNERYHSPMTYWVHKGVDEENHRYADCLAFEPPLPPKDPLKGYPFLTVTVLSFDMVFASSDEMKHFIEVMQQKNLPTTTFLSEQRGVAIGPNSHWLSRFPAKLKTWTKRQKLVDAVKKARQAILDSGIRF